jgi:imidazolonepropionase-like amidohydrolase
VRTRTPVARIVAIAAAGIAAAGGSRAAQSEPAYAIEGARVFTAVGPPLARATILIRGGVIEAVGTDIRAPAGAIVVDASGLSVYPGLIDLSSAAALVPEPEPEPERARVPEFETLEDAARVKRERVLRADYRAVDHLRTDSPAQAGLARAGITAVLAVPSGGVFRGQSALVSTLAPPAPVPAGSAVSPRAGLTVIRFPVATHVDLAGRGSLPGYPQSLLGTIAFVRQAFVDAGWQRDAIAHHLKTGASAPRVELALAALEPALAGTLSVAFEAAERREIDRALGLARQFSLDPIIVGGIEAGERAADLAQAGARVVLALHEPAGPAAVQGPVRLPLRVLRRRANAPGVPAALARAGVPFAFTAAGADDPGALVAQARRAIRQGGLAPDQALRALTIDAARIAGAADRAGSIERGKIASMILVEGDLFDAAPIRQIFIEGHPIAR